MEVTNQTKLPEFFLAGAQKCATTWLYQCLKEHPQIFVPRQNITNFFNVNYFRGFDWYKSWYQDVSNEKVIFDTSMTYMRDDQVPKRIYDYNPNAKFIFSLRNPIDRAFSHYWHEKKKGKITFSFEEALFYSDVGNYDLYENWIKGGFYHDHIQNFLKFFPKEQMLFVLVDDINNEPENVLEKIYDFAGVDPNFKPSVLNKKLNVAGKRKGKLNNLSILIGKFIPKKLKKKIKLLLSKMQSEQKTEYEYGLSQEYRQILSYIFSPENVKLEKVINRNLSHWK